MNKEEKLLEERDKILKNIKTKEDRVAQIEKELEELKNKKWKPEVGEIYHYISNRGSTLCETNDNFPGDEDRFNIGNYFKTHEEAEFEVERIKVLEELKKFSYEFSDEEWEYGDFDKFILYYNYETNEIDIDCFWNCKYDSIHFKTKEDAEKAIDKIGEERLKKYYFKVGNNE